MERYVVSARKYRPVLFDTVVGQEHVTGTLKNAIRNQHVASAFLFTGPRGVGKTTCARILARTLNCENLNDDLSTCGECPSCKSFDDGHSLNIFELDAASNNSVEDIRNLIQQVQIAPQIGNKKVYIIDEVHMLSSAAFNAFLKTLEEPPSYAIFILATTEKHKILPTILSRCQVFDFRRITVTDIAKHLAEIALKEGVDAEPQALHTIAQKADGGLRDALSIFDQLASFGGDKLTYADVLKNLNVLDHEHYFAITDHLLNGDAPGALLAFNDVLFQGFDG
ncbi:MAG: DNA polymerase III subunit gamma/tau, partial [Flavobacteriales bacterium]|nr:DNA polymerase III subunit gamma/tau [Flavobacteriales bacterium]